VDAWDFRPGNSALVERAVLSIVGGDAIGTWLPGEDVVRYSKGIAQKLPAHARIAVDVHYRKSIMASMPQSAIDLYFTASPRSALRHRALPCAATSVNEDIEAIAVSPAAAGAGESVELIARRPNGSVEPLVVIPEFQPANRLSYRFRNRVPLPRGTIIEVRSSAPGCGAALEFIAGTTHRVVAR
jgi:hypothetical protein